MARCGYTQHQLVSWLDAQERKVEQPVEAVNELLTEFDPLYNPPGDPELERFLRFGQFVQNYDRVEHFIEQGRRTVRFRFLRDLESSLAAKIMSKIKQHVRTRHAIKIQTTLELRNTEDGELLEFYQARKKSGWLSTLTQTQHWVRAEEELRLQNAKLDRPNTKWVYERTLLVDVTVILDRQPLQIGLGRLPPWLRNKREVISLDIYNDNRCLHRCLAVHRGACIDRCTRKARELENNFFAAYPRLRDKLNASHLPLLEKHYKQGIAAYLVLPNGDFVLLHTPANYHKVGTPTMNIGIYNDHAFLITDINKVTNNYTCGYCSARFTRADNLRRHADSRCTRGQTKINCPGARIHPPESAYEKAFYPDVTFGFKGVAWIEWEAKRRGIHIHHARCGHGGERHILGAPVDGYHPETKTIFQFHGCFWHGCEKCFPNQGDKVLRHDRQGNPITRKVAYQRTVRRTQLLRAAGYTVAERWSHEAPRPWWNDRCPPKRNETYPHAIVYDFKSYQDKTKATLPTRDLSYESEHVPISVSIADTLNPEPEYIVSKDPNELIHLFYQSLERRHEAIREDVVNTFGLPDIDGISEQQGQRILEWFNQVPVVGFNSGHYDLKLIRKYFIPQLANENGVFAAEKNGRIMFINTPQFKFLDIMNYLAPGITYDKWVKTYGATQTKSWLPYEWFDSPDKLDYPGLPSYFAWYSQLKNAYVLSPKEYDSCRKTFHERGMKTFGDWLEYYNNLDVAPFLEALQKMRQFYTDLGVDIFKDAVSLPGVSMQYILRGTLKGRNAPELYAPSKEAYDMLKAAVVGGPSLVFIRKHVAGQTRIRPHKFDLARITKRILGYDANSLYPSTMDMPCGKETVGHHEDPEAAARILQDKLYSGTWFGFAEVDIEVPRELWEKFEEFPPLFLNRSVPNASVPQHMHAYLRNSGRTRIQDQQKLLGVLLAKKMLIYAPPLEVVPRPRSQDHGCLPHHQL